MPRAVLVVLAVLAACTALPLPREGAYHPSDAELGVTRIVHGSLILELGKTRLLVDPWFHSGFTTRQTEPLGITPEHLPDIAAVLLNPRRVVPLGYGAASGWFPLVWYASTPVARFQQAATDAGYPADRIVVLEPGESWHYFR